ncbi:ATP-binding protein [Streptomyces sp. NPDC048290]|uniref:ATP-binding protein n=1 Tax=Streptomyces sp. NPDC048290 TaxID=3155811 RepID=UPI00341B1AE6
MLVTSETAAVVLGATTAAGFAWGACMARSRARTARRGQAQIRAARARSDVAEQSVADLLEELRYLNAVRIPALAQHLVSPHLQVPGPRVERLAGTEAAALMDAVLSHIEGIVRGQRSRVDAAAWTAVRGTASTTQSLANRVQSALEELQRRHEDPELLGTLFFIDRLNEQLLRQQQKLAIASGRWPGHVRADTHVPDAVIGAQSRVTGWERVKVTNRLTASDVGITGRAAEPVAVIVAELLSNAVEHSREDLPVDVLLMQTDSGTVSIVIDDAGSGMTAQEMDRAGRRMAGEGLDGLLLSGLGDPPALGLVAAGRCATENGITVSFRTSPFHGVRAIVSIPPDLLVTMDAGQPVSALAPLPAPHPRRDTGSGGPDSIAGGGLPTRRRKSRAAATGRPDTAVLLPDPATAAARFDEFQSGLPAAHSAPDPEDA